MGSITKRELHPSLLKLISEGAQNSQQSTKLIQLKSTVTISVATPTVDIKISEYNKDTDILMVFKNSVYLEENDDYTITSDSRSINRTGGYEWNNAVFNFVVFKNVNVNAKDVKSMSDDSIPESKLSKEVKQKLNKNLNLRTSYTGENEISYAKIATCKMEKYSSNTSLVFNYITSESENKYQSDGQVKFMLNYFKNTEIHTILLEPKSVRVNNVNFCAKISSESDTHVTIDLYAYILQKYTILDLHLVNEYLSPESTITYHNNSKLVFPAEMDKLKQRTIWSKFKPFIETESTTNDKVNYWAEICEINFTNQWQQAIASIDLIDTCVIPDANIKSGTLNIKASQSAAIGSQPVVMISLNSANISKENIKAVVNSDSTRSVIKVFVKLDNKYMTYLAKPNIIKSYEFVMIDNSELVQSLPSGTVIDCK